MLHNLVEYFMWGGGGLHLIWIIQILYSIKISFFQSSSRNKCSLFIAQWKYKLGASVALTLSHNPFANLPQVDQDKITSSIGNFGPIFFCFLTYKIYYLSCDVLTPHFQPKDVSRSGENKIGYSFQTKIKIKFGYKNPKGHIAEFGCGMC